MRGRERVYHYAHRGIFVALGILFYCFLSMYITMPVMASSPISMDRYDDLVSGTSATSSGDVHNDSGTPEGNRTPSQVVDSKDEINMKQFNGRTLDTIIFILGGLAGFMMVLQLTMFCITRIFPSTNKWVEKLSVIGIDGYDRGFVIPTIKILLLGVLSFLCISGTVKQIVGFILGLFAVKFS